MTQAMQDLLTSYTRAVETELNESLEDPIDDEKWAKAKVALRERRARLVDAIEKLERDSKLWEAKK